MPSPVTKARLMRRSGVNANPPICRSKDKNTCLITWNDCITGQQIKQQSWRGIGRQQCIDHVDDLPGTKGTRYFSAPIMNFEEEVDFDNCP